MTADVAGAAARRGPDLRHRRAANPEARGRQAARHVALGDSDRVRVGEDVVALGQSARTRSEPDARHRLGGQSRAPGTFFSVQEPFIQVDTPINPAILAARSSTAAAKSSASPPRSSPTRRTSGWSFRSTWPKATLPGLLKDGHLTRPWLGFHGQFVDNNLKRLLRLPLRTAFLSKPSNRAALLSRRGSRAATWK